MAATVRFFAAAQEAVGSDTMTTDAQTLGSLKEQLLAGHPALTGILNRCAVLVDGARVDDAFPLAEAKTIDVLPPFAGG
ncbi:MoaD/ThiS family protein [Microbacterium esteraromaticum]|uniref:MoaD/ThiS family protein n=1 Tax=Microbacterium esteraromaticum TaxID=57043 RepID=UPI00195A8509|nr:MoaD/ThiS family protein [Microbacterium esteraromaticum]MBM7465560.1 molybdopterin converting factor small subunit [Microbacterium esteraromaticum]